MKMRNILLALFFVSLGCSGSLHKEDAAKSNGDLAICSFCLYKDSLLCMEKKEFFVVEKQDTSAYSVLILSRNGNVKSAELTLDLYEKMYSLYEEYEESSDTTAVGISGRKKKRDYYIPSYRDLLHEVKLSMDEASQDYHLQTLKYFILHLSNLGDIAVQTALALNDHVQTCSHADIRKALETTSFRKDLDEIFVNYGLKVKTIQCQEEIFLVPKKDYLTSANLSKGVVVPEQLVDVEVCVTLTKENEI